MPGCSSWAFALRRPRMLLEPEHSRQSGCAYQKSAGDEDKDTALLVTWLGVKRRDLVLNLLEWKRLHRLSDILFPFEAQSWVPSHPASR